MADSSLVYIPLKFRHLSELCEYYNRFVKGRTPDGDDYAEAHQESLDALRDFVTHFRGLEPNGKDHNPQEELDYIKSIKKRLGHVLDHIGRLLTETEGDLEATAEDDPSRVHSERARDALKLFKEFFDDFLRSLDRLLQGYHSVTEKGGSGTPPKVYKLLKRLWEAEADNAKAYLAVATCPKARARL